MHHPPCLFVCSLLYMRCSLLLSEHSLISVHTREPAHSRIASLQCLSCMCVLMCIVNNLRAGHPAVPSRIYGAGMLKAVLLQAHYKHLHCITSAQAVCSVRCQMQCAKYEFPACPQDWQTEHPHSHCGWWVLCQLDLASRLEAVARAHRFTGFTCLCASDTSCVCVCVCVCLGQLCCS